MKNSRDQLDFLEMPYLLIVLALYPLSLSLDYRLRIFYLFSLCYFQTVNPKKVCIKNMESKVYESFSNFFNFPDTALKLDAYYFQSNLANVAITQF